MKFWMYISSAAADADAAAAAAAAAAIVAADQWFFSFRWKLQLPPTPCSQTPDGPTTTRKKAIEYMEN